MKSDELRDTVISYANSTSVKECAELFEGIVSLDTIYRWTREAKHLSYVYTKDQCMREIHNYKKSSPSYSSLPTRNRIIHTFQPHFFHKERELWRDKKVRLKLIKNRKQYLNKDEFSDREILRGFKISGIHMGYSHFSPLWFLKFIKDNNIQSAYDPCGGWGHRMIGAYLGDIKYIYNDKWDKTFDGCREIGRFLGYECSIYNEDCTSFTPSDDYECIFTCPPYENIEIYNDETIDDFDLFLKNLFIHSIKPSVEHIGLVINKPYIQNIIDACPYKLKEIFELGTTNHSSHLNKDNSIKGEYLLHFTK